MPQNPYPRSPRQRPSPRPSSTSAGSGRPAWRPPSSPPSSRWSAWSSPAASSASRCSAHRTSACGATPRPSRYAFAAFGCGLLATGLLFLLLRTTPSPITYFGWIVGLVTAFAAVIPLTMGTDFGAKVAACLVNAAIGVAIGALTVSAARRSILYSPPTEPELQPPYI